MRDQKERVFSGKTASRELLHNRPRGAILAYFDVQPITVKAYGGRRYTRGARRPLRPL